MLLLLAATFAGDACPELDRWIADAPTIVEVVVLGCERAPEPTRPREGPLTVRDVDRTAATEGLTRMDCALRVERVHRAVDAPDRLTVRTWVSMRDQCAGCENREPWLPGARVLAFGRVDGSALVLHDEAVPSAFVRPGTVGIPTDLPVCRERSWTDVVEHVTREVRP